LFPFRLGDFVYRYFFFGSEPAVALSGTSVLHYQNTWSFSSYELAYWFLLLVFFPLLPCTFKPKPTKL
jgi:hypothetical protein